MYSRACSLACDRCRRESGTTNQRRGHRLPILVGRLNRCAVWAAAQGVGAETSRGQCPALTWRLERRGVAGLKRTPATGSPVAGDGAAPCRLAAEPPPRIYSPLFALALTANAANLRPQLDRSEFFFSSRGRDDPIATLYI